MPQTKKIIATNKDKKGNIWIGTYGGGLSKYDYHSFTNYSTKDGLSHNYIHTLFEDSKGNIWIGSRNGVNVYNGYTFDTIKLNNSSKQIQVRAIFEDSKNMYSEVL